MAKKTVKTMHRMDAGKHGIIPAGGLVVIDVKKFPAHLELLKKGYVQDPGDAEGEAVDLTVPAPEATTTQAAP